MTLLSKCLTRHVKPQGPRHIRYTCCSLCTAPVVETTYALLSTPFSFLLRKLCGCAASQATICAAHALDVPEWCRACVISDHHGISTACTSNVRSSSGPAHVVACAQRGLPSLHKLGIIIIDDNLLTWCTGRKSKPA